MLIGRERETSALWDRFEAAAAGHTSVALVAGEPGIGKSRLIEALAARAAAAGATVLRGGASDAEGMPPYLPFLEALGRYIRTAPPDRLRDEAGPGAPTLAAILPELPARLGGLAPGYPLPAEQARLRLFEAVGAFLAALAAPAPLLLVLDDLHWADTASLDLLCHVVRHEAGARLLVLGAYREGEVERNPALERALAELARLRVLATVTLAPLSGSEVAALAATALGSAVDAAAGRLLHARSEGNPFFAEELLRGWQESGVLVRADGRWVLATGDGTGADPALPATIVTTIRHRLTRLAPEVVDLLRTAAIVGRTFDVTLLASVTEAEVEAVEDRLQAAVGARLLHAAQSGTYRFSHDRVRECLYAEVTSARRTRLHGAIGMAIERRGGDDGAQHLADLAFHFAHSGDRGRGAAYSVRAAREAMRTFAAEDAATQFRMALALLDPADSQRGELLRGLGEAALLAGREHEALDAFEAARTWFLQAGDPVAAGRAAHALGQANWHLEAHAPARAAFEAALALVEHRSPPDEAQVLVDLASLLALSMGRQEAGLTHARRALDLARRTGNPHLEAAAGRTVGNLLMRANDLATGIPLLERSLALAEAADDPAEAAECCPHLALAYAWSGRLRQAQELMLRWLAFALRCHDPYQLRHVYTMRAFPAWAEGRWAEAERLVDEARSLVERLTSPEPLAFLRTVRGWLAWSRGDYPAAEALFAEAMVTFRQMGPSVLVWYLGQLGLALAAQGKRDEALGCVDELEGLIGAHPGGTMPTAEPLTYMAQIAVLLGERERAGRCSARLRPFQGQCHDLLVDRLLGEIATLSGDAAAARAHLDEAEALARREGMRPELARTIAARAELALAEGGPAGAARARDLLAAALALFDELGMSGEAARARARLHRLAQPAAAPARPSLPAGLSEREAEVLRLVAAGKSNRQIAGELFLSEKTVANHLTAIFTKTGSDNRAAAAVFAIRHGLA